LIVKFSDFSGGQCAVKDADVLNQSLIAPGAVVSRANGPTAGRGRESHGIGDGVVQLTVHVNGIDVAGAAFGHGADEMMPFVILDIGDGFDFTNAVVAEGG